MKYIKTFENISKKFKVGQYVIVKYISYTPQLYDFLNNNIGKIVSITEHFEIPKYIIYNVKYENIPDDIKWAFNGRNKNLYKAYSNELKLATKITIELFDFCEFFGMHEAIKKLIILKDNSKAVGFTININTNKHYYKKSDNIEMLEINIHNDFYINDGDSIGLRIGDYGFSYGYLRALNEKGSPGIIINFYNVDIEDDNILLYIKSKKYNI